VSGATQCSNCEGIHYGDCERPHSPHCFCERCRGIPFVEWEKKQRRLPDNRGTILTKEDCMNLPDPTTAGGGELPPFLKPKDINKKGQTEVTLTGDMRESNSQFGEGIEVGAQIGNKTFSWTIKFESGNYRRLFERFGRKKWKGVVTVERKQYLGNDYVAVV
jgi:hypothetical protein